MRREIILPTKKKQAVFSSFLENSLPVTYCASGIKNAHYAETNSLSHTFLHLKLYHNGRRRRWRQLLVNQITHSNAVNC